MGVHELDVVKPRPQKGQHGRSSRGLGSQQLGGDFCNRDLDMLALFYGIFTIFEFGHIQSTRNQVGRMNASLKGRRWMLDVVGYCKGHKKKRLVTNAQMLCFEAGTNMCVQPCGAIYDESLGRIAIDISLYFVIYVFVKILKTKKTLKTIKYKPEKRATVMSGWSWESCVERLS